MAEDVLIIGAGGHARVIADIARLRGDRVLGFLDDREDNPHGLPI
ncbi:MAG TPA: sialic acid O-acetyltransferase NeuD family sugar O-acyltransferase, partial [Candidatus Limnocylindria bacterium]|nr:sialic acid O-acetyltransferase NeuD family sugar O-acyltransferase [Candidatus Limnocylindria bacterium]